MTNYERIKQMSIDEMAKFLFDPGCNVCDSWQNYKCDGDCANLAKCTVGIKKWLESEVTE